MKSMSGISFLRVMLIAITLSLFFSTAKAACSDRVGTVYVNFPGASIATMPDAKVGDVVYDKTVSFQITFNQSPIYLNCDGRGPNYAQLSSDCTSKICVTENPSFGITVDLDLPGYNSTTRQYRLPDGVLSTPITVKARMRIYILSLWVNPYLQLYYYGRGPTALAGNDNGTGANGYYFRPGTINLVSTTCMMSNPSTVDLNPATVQDLTGVGATAKSRDFTITLKCSGESQVSKIGIGFNGAYQHASGAPGVIATDSGVGNAKGVALQILNRTTQQPIKFNTLETGPSRLSNGGTYPYPFAVRYYQTDSTIGPGQVRGRVEVSIQLQ